MMRYLIGAENQETKSVLRFFLYYFCKVDFLDILYQNLLLEIT